ncbi:hypothetical protein P8452_39064 [Trifolium repens]|nr:hypothetical protein P8452_39064 [Trifolium repens]
MASIPNDILIEISSWLPAKAIHKFRSNDKFFSIFSKDKKFALRQSQNALLNDASSFFIQSDFFERYHGNIVELHHLSGEDNSSGVSKAVLEYLAKSAKILSSANGLILCRDTTGNSKVQIFISNPATQTWLPIPIPEQLQGMNVDLEFNVILECDDKDNFMVYFFYDNSEFWSPLWDCKVYSIKEGIWKEKEKSLFTGSRSLKFDTAVFHKGNIHFISDSASYLVKGSFYYRPYIMSYNFENGTTRMLRVPKGAQRGSDDINCNMKIFKWKKNTNSTQSICLVRLSKCVFTIWILTNYEANLWERILKIRVKAMGVMEEDPIVTGFSVSNGDLLIFATKNKIYSYGLSASNENYMKFEEICDHGCDNQVSFTSYSNTMRSCGTDDAKPLLPHSTSFHEQAHEFEI